MEKEGLSTEQARSKIWLIDSKGVITTSRDPVKTGAHKMHYAKEAEESNNFEDILDVVKPTCLVGVSAIAGAFTPAILKKMTTFSERPIIFALSNPTSKAECTAEQAYVNTDGQCVFASGSPFDAVTYNGKTYHPGQGNNAYIFPGVAFAVIACGVKEIKNEVFLVAAEALAELVSEKDLSEGRVYPPLETINQDSLRLAAIVAEWLYKEGYATEPEPDDKYEFLKSKSYNATYE